MKSFLNAIQEGRFIELPDTDKDKSLEYLSNIIEAIPGVGFDIDILKEVKEREKLANTGLGRGLACPHVRTSKEGELLCAVGWSPAGIDYGAGDGQKVNLVIMYYIPESQKNSYLKELSGVAKALQKKDINVIAQAKDINSARNSLLDWINESIEDAAPDSIAKLIKLEAKQAKITPKEITSAALIAHFYILASGNEKLIVLSENKAITDIFENNTELKKNLSVNNDFILSDHRIIIYETKNYSSNRVLYSCIAVKI
jgi:nitrogen PTS system EIIA component